MENRDSLIENAEIGHQNAVALLNWWSDKEFSGSLHKQKKLVKTTRGPQLELSYFFDNLTLRGKETSAMGCFWRTRFTHDPKAPIEPPAALEMFIRRSFPKACLGSETDPLRGFEFKVLRHKRKGLPEYGVYAKENPLEDLAEIGTNYDWIVLEAEVHDFFHHAMGPGAAARWMKKKQKMSSFILAHEDYLTSFHPQEPDAVGESCFGYSFLPLAPCDSFFGYGPGKFQAAVKQFRFILQKNGDLDVHMSFLVAPRSEKILSLGSAGFDPVYPPVHLIDSLTGGLFKIRQKFHDNMDTMQLEKHAVIYQALIDGLQSVWESHDWTLRGRSANSRT